jgi:hypothetical protein
MGDETARAERSLLGAQRLIGIDAAGANGRLGVRSGAYGREEHRNSAVRLDALQWEMGSPSIP